MRSHFLISAGQSRRLGRLFLLRILSILVLALGAGLLLGAPRFSEWSPPVNLGPLVNTRFNEAGPALSKDGLSLYFQSNRMPGGYGGNDIWVSQRASRENAWGDPVNLGPTINTAANEDAPAFSRDGHTMFFNSDRLGSLGMRDIYIARRTHTDDDFGWEEPVNAGPGVNSTFMDAGPSYLENEEAGTPLLYFGSTRLGGVYDIYVSAQADLRQRAGCGRLMGTGRPGAGAQQSTERPAPQRPVRWSGDVPALGPSGQLRPRRPLGLHARDHPRPLVGSGQPGRHCEQPVR